MGQSLNFLDNEKITIKIINSLPQEAKLILLNPKDKLLTIRQKLEVDYKFTLLKFFRRFSENDENENYGGSYGFAEIELKDEEQFSLSEIIGNNLLYIKCKIQTDVDWNFLNEERKLDYGCTMALDEIKKADKRAFVMENCELKEIGAEGCENGVVEFKSVEELMKITNL